MRIISFHKGNRKVMAALAHTDVTYIIARANRCRVVCATCVSTAKVLTMKLVCVTRTGSEVDHADTHRNWEP